MGVLLLLLALLVEVFLEAPLLVGGGVRRRGRVHGCWWKWWWWWLRGRGNGRVRAVPAWLGCALCLGKAAVVRPSSSRHGLGAESWRERAGVAWVPEAEGQVRWCLDQSQRALSGLAQ